MSLPNLMKAVIGPFDYGADEDGKKFAILKVPLGFNAEILAVRIGTDAAVTKADTNYNTYNVKKTGGTTVASIANGPNSAAGTTFAAGVPQDMTLVSAARILAESDVLTLEPTKTGTGLAMPGCVVEVEYQLLRKPTG